MFRLTLLKGYNMDDVARYAQLVARGAPCFIEVKGVTFCGAGETSELTMKSVPFHHEVCRPLTVETTYGAHQWAL